MGDPGGVGPEVVLKALADQEIRALGRMIVVGDRGVFEQTARRLSLPLDLPDVTSDSPRDGFPDAALIHLPHVAAGHLAFGKPTVEGGRASAEAVIRAVELALDGRVDAIVTAPICKEAIHKAGYHFPGHTELLAHCTQARRAVMMMVGGGIRAALVTTHLALADVPSHLTTELILETIEITDSSLKKLFDIARPRIGVCGLNPHAGEQGLFGDEEARVITPAIDAAAERGVHCSGPVPADAGFYMATKGTYDALIAMYHDQGNIPVKLLAFDTGVNVTLGLPIIRTSPDHGTAYDIAGQGKANPSSLKSALNTACLMAAARSAERR